MARDRAVLFWGSLVYEILGRGDRVIATDENASERLAHLGELGAAMLDLDVTTSEAHLDSKVEGAIKIYNGIDIIVNNAERFEFGLVEEVRCVMVVNLCALECLLREANIYC